MASLPKNIKASKRDFVAALEGNVNETQKEILNSLIRQIEHLDKEVDIVEQKILEHGRQFSEQVECLKSIPGVDDFSACAIIGEIGADMRTFLTAQHLTSWGCICPGNHESAGKKYSTNIRKGSNHLKTLLVQIAWVASKTKTYLGAKYRKLVVKKGKKRAIIALARKILTIIYHILNKTKRYEELGIDYLDNINIGKKRDYYLKQLEKLGCEVTCTQTA